MNRINEIIKKSHIKPRKYVKKKKIIIIETNEKKNIIKKSKKNEKKYIIKKSKINEKIYEYLKSRNFNYMPEIIEKNDEYNITEYLEEFDIPKEQKILDMIDLVSLLHNKTTHYKDVTIDDYKEIYEDIKNNIEYLYTYYMDTISIIESHTYMSPSEYMLARNISEIFKILEESNTELDNWYKMIKTKTKKRLVVIHNNLKIEHFIENKKNYLISWDKSKIDLPIFDIYKLYTNHGLEFDFSSILKRYEKNYPLTNDEKKLLFILIMLPKKIEINKNEYKNTKEISNMINKIYKTKIFLKQYKN